MRILQVETPISAVKVLPHVHRVTLCLGNRKGLPRIETYLFTIIQVKFIMNDIDILQTERRLRLTT